MKNQSMFGHQHPIHHSTPRHQTVDRKTVSSKFELLDCRIGKNQPATTEGAKIYFTNTFKAAKYLELIDKDQQSFEARQTSIQEIFQHIEDTNKDYTISIDPCPACGFNDILTFDKSSSFDYVRSTIENLIWNKQLQISSIENQVIELCREGNYDDAFDILQVVISHLDCSEPRLHYQIGVCAKKLNAHETLQKSLNNLEVLDKDRFWLEHLKAKILED